MKMTDSVLASCFSMCPKRELLMREKEGLLHVLEIDEKSKHMKRPKADPSRIVKCYSRSGAGMSKSDDPSQLRPGPVLLMTVRYLLGKVTTRTDVEWSVIYEFIFDRLRAVRQDMVIQRLDIPTSILLLEHIVKFYIYSAERLCEKSLTEFVPKFNNQHLHDCIKQLLVFYDDKSEESQEKTPMGESCRSTVEALHILLYLGDVRALRRCLSLPIKYREQPDIKKAFEVSCACYAKNYIKVCREISKLTSLHAMAAFSNLPQIRRDTLAIMSTAYNTQNLTFPGSELKENLIYNDLKRVQKDCEYFGLTFIGGNICFQKKNFKNEILSAHPEQHFSDATLHSLLPYVLIA